MLIALGGWNKDRNSKQCLARLHRNSGGETGFEMHEDRIWTAENSPNPQMCKILTEGMDFHQCLLNMEIHPSEIYYVIQHM